jgi:hypothetical protein
MNTSATLDTQPWFRQFWPWFVISIPAATVCACLYTIWLAVSTSDSLVVEKGRGVDVQTDAFLSAEALARDAGITADIVINGDSGAVVVSLVNAPQSAEDLSLQFSHPTIKSQDFALALVPLPEAGSFTAFLPQRLSGRWYVSLQDGTEWRVSGILTEAGYVELNADGTGR